MEWFLLGAKTRKTLLFCVNGVHRSGNVACMIMCSVNNKLEPNRAMDHLQNVRCISGPKERQPQNPYTHVSLGEWFDNGGPWTSRAPFLAAGPLLATPSNFLCFPPTPTGPFIPSPTDSASRSPAGFPQAPRPRPSFFLRRRLRCLPQGGRQRRRHWQGNLFSFHPRTPDLSHRRQSENGSSLAHPRRRTEVLWPSSCENRGSLAHPRRRTEVLQPTPNANAPLCARSQPWSA